MSTVSTIDCHDMTVRFGERAVLDALSLTLRADQFTVILGPNGCGKSTTLLAASRMHTLRGGQVLLNGEDIHRLRSVEVARRLALLPQSSDAPDDLRVRSLVSYGRYPYLRRFGGLRAEDEAAIDRAIELTGLTDLSDRLVDSLSGGERQRTWIACALAQETSWLLLDEPTTYLDLGHQISVMRLLRRLHEDLGIAIAMVLHDLGHAATYADRLIVMEDGAIIADGSPQDVLTAELIKSVYGAEVMIERHPSTGRPVVIPAP